MMKKYIACISLLSVIALSGCGQVESSSQRAAGVTKPVQTEVTSEEEPFTAENTSETETVTETETETAETPTTETASETETVPETTAAQVTDAEKNIIPGVLGKFGDYTDTFDGMSKPSTTYNYSIDGSELFGVDMKGVMFFEFSNRTDELICYGYRFGNVKAEGKDTYPYSGDELKAAYEKVLDKLTGWYGGSPNESTLVGIDTEYSVSLEDDSEIWSVYGVNMWGEASGINELILSHAISNDKMMAL